ncbi:hypothetical protein JHK82_038924 [Glycine max]|nr:hypothetical protein JHK82_038924 [Glycine max]
MNRSFRAVELQMQDAFNQRRHQLAALRSSSPRVMDRDDELALFLEMRNREKERNDLLLRAAEDFDAAAPLGSDPGNSPLFNVPPAASAPARKTGADDFLNSENDKNDYDWLLTPPGTPLFPSLEMETSKTVMSQLGAPTVRPTPLKARFANSPLEDTGRSNFVSKQPASSPGLTSSGGGIRRPSSAGNLSELTGRSNSVIKQRASSPGLTSSGGGIRRPSSSENLSEHSGRSNLVSKQSASSPGLTSSGGVTRRHSSSGNIGSRSTTPAGRSTLTTVSKSPRPSTPTAVSKSARPSTPTSQTTTPSMRTTVGSTKTSVSSAKPMVSAPKTSVSVTKTTTISAAKTTITSRSSTPLSRSTARSSTPTTKPTLPASRPTSRASTPARRPSTPPNVPTVSSPSVKTSSVSKSAPVISRQPVPSRGTSPTVKSRPWKPSEMPGFSLDAPPNLRTTLPERSLSTTRGRPGAPNLRSSSVEPASNGRPRRQSCSPSRGRSSNGISRPTGSSMPAVNRAYSKANDNVSPVVMGTKMVERVINMRKLAPPRLDDKNSFHNLSGKSSSSPDSSGFGRSLSKKSLDMAIRHMVCIFCTFSAFVLPIEDKLDIRRRAPGDLRPSLMTKIPASSICVYSLSLPSHLRAPMASLWRAATGMTDNATDYDGVEFWSNPERTGWLTKQGEYIKTWRRRWFVLKQGKLFWFKDSAVTRASRPRGVVPVATCLTVKGAEDILNKPNAFELSTRSDTMYFIADSEKEKEDWINSIGRSIVQHSRSVTDSEIIDYDNNSSKR